MLANDLRPLPQDSLPIAFFGPVEKVAGRAPSPPGEFAVIREMLSALDTLTYPGQLQNMAKIVAFIRKNGSRVLRNASPRNRSTCAQLLDDLAGECQRLLPDTRTFRRGAENLLTLLAAIA
jgi:hypothetical protein